MAGLLTVFKKELADDFTSWRFIILFTLVLLVGVSAVYVAGENIRSTVSATDRFIFIALFTTSGGALLSFLQFMVLFIPIVGIALGFDAVNGEQNSGTMSRLLAQPIYRDAVINGKFMAGVTTIAIMMVTIVLLVSGLGLRMIGVAPTAEEAVRLLFFVITAIIYGAFWLALSILFSIFIRRVATSALASIAFWIFFYFFIGMIVRLVSQQLAPAGETAASQLSNLEFQMAVLRVSPITLFQDAMIALLIPGIRTMGQLTQLQQSSQFMVPNPLSMGQSLLIVWPYLVTIILLTVICFAISYIKFMREEIRST